MKTAASATWNTLHPKLFNMPPPSSQGYDVNVLFDDVLRHVNAPHVEKIVFRTSFSMGAHRLFDALTSGFGHPLKTPCGELSYLRVRSYAKGAFVVHPKRASQPMIPGEIREITCVTLDQDSRTRDGSIVAMRCMCMAQPMQDATEVASMPIPTEIAPQSMYGLSVVPLLLIDKHVVKPRKKDTELTYHGYPLLLFSTTDMTIETKQTSSGVQLPSRSCLVRSPSIFTFTEWILEVANPSKYERSTVMINRMTKQAYEFEHAKLCSKMHTHFQRQKDHPTVDDLGEQTVQDCEQVKNVAQMLAECTTVGFVLDLHACGTMDAVHLPFFIDPTGFPLYVSICIILAATPSLIVHWVPDSSMDNDEKRAISQVFDVYQSMTPGTTTVLETVVQIALEQMATSRSNQGNRPMASEHMRRQGVTLCHELCTVLHHDCVSHLNAIEAECCGTESFKEAQEMLTPACLSERAKMEFRANGVCGSTRQTRTDGTRCATRTVRFRHLLQLMLEVNELLETGIFRMRREYEENTGEAAARHSKPEALMLNVAAFNAALHATTTYLVQGPVAVAESSGFAVFPLRHRTRTTCGKCKFKFDHATTAVRSRLSHCPGCRAYYCTDCYNEKVAQIRKRTGADTVPSQHAAKHTDILFCSVCLSRHTTAATPRTQPSL